MSLGREIDWVVFTKCYSGPSDDIHDYSSNKYDELVRCWT